VEKVSFIGQRGSVPFRPHARLIRLLGDELISDEVMAIVELVKNGYDADASHVMVMLGHISDPQQGWISIKDDGSGMNLHTLLHEWMEPATSHKRGRNGGKAKTTRGRIQLGEKGVGRFAADKLGAELELVTKHADVEEELFLQVNWQHFDHDTYLDDVKCSWHTREPVVFPGDHHGTLLTIHSLRTAWNQDMVTRLNNGLTRLVSPFTRSADFTIEIHCPEFPSISGRVINPILETAPYRLSGVVDGNGVLSRHDGTDQTVDLRPLCHSHFLSSHDEMRLPCCGPFALALHVWDLELQFGKGAGIDRTLREAIKASSGVSIYRDDFRIWPYGEKDDDWLELNQRRVNNPTLRISNNQIIGFVEITHEDNPDLRDRTSREGLIDTQAFFDLKALVLAALSLLEAERFDLRRQQISSVKPAADKEEHDTVLQYLSQIQADNTNQSIHAITREIARLYRGKLEQERVRYEQVARLAGIGLAAELLTDAFSREVGNTVILLRTLQGEARTGTISQIQQLVDALTARMAIINEQLDLMEPLYRPRLQENEPVDVRGAVYDTVSLLRHRLIAANTRVALGGSQNLTVRINRGHFMQVLMIVLDNAIAALKEASTTDSCIEIQVVEDSSILIADNGPGIPHTYHKLIFEPYFSARKAGRGLGLHVARDILAVYNSSIDLAPGKSSLRGACFEIRFDRRRLLARSLIE